MDKTKRQIRAEVAERLKNQPCNIFAAFIEAAGYDYDDTSNRQQDIDIICDILTDDELPEGDELANLSEQRDHWIGVAEKLFRRFYPHDEYGMPNDPVGMVNAVIDKIESERDNLKAANEVLADAFKGLQAEHDEWKAKAKHYREHTDRLMESIKKLAQKQPRIFDPEAPYDCVKLVGKYIDELACERDDGVKRSMTNLEWLMENDREELVAMAASCCECKYCAHRDTPECNSDTRYGENDCYGGNREWLMSEHVDANGTPNGTCPNVIGQASNDSGHLRTMSQKEPNHVRDVTKMSEVCDEIHQPAHYTHGGIECIDVIRSSLSPEEFRGFCKGAALKYLYREGHKGGNVDLLKASEYCQFAADKPTTCAACSRPLSKVDNYCPQCGAKRPRPQGGDA